MPLHPHPGASEAGGSGHPPADRALQVYLTQSFLKSVLQKSIPTKIRELIPYISKSKGYVDGFVGELTSAKRL